MTQTTSAGRRRLVGLTAFCTVALGLAVSPAPAQARIFVGIGVPFPFFGPPMYYPPPPVYYPPPYYAPPPVVYAPPPPYSPEYGGSCNAGAYACPLDRPLPPGSACYCIGNGGQRVRGNAN